MNIYLDTLLNFIISTYFMDSRCLIVFTDDENNFKNDFNVPVINVKINNNSVHSEVFLNYFGCQEIVIKSNRPMTVFTTFEKEIRSSMERFNKRKFLITSGTNVTENSMKIFESPDIQYVSDLLVIQDKSSINSNVGDEIYEFWTHKYTGLQNNSDKVLLDIWHSVNQSFCYHANLYPDKLNNQMGRVVKLATFQYEPYVIIGSSKKMHKGSEMSSMLAFAEFLNMTPELIINPEDFWGAIYENWTGNGLLGNLLNDKADAGMAALYTWEEEYHYLDLSFPVLRTGITCLVPAPELDAGWLTPLYSYSYPLWGFVISTFIIAITAHAIIYYLEDEIVYHENATRPVRYKQNRSIFIIYKLFVVQAINISEIPPGKHGIFFMGLMFIFSVFLSNTYSSGLASVMTSPRYYNVVETVDDFIDSGIIWVGTHSDWLDSISQAKQEPYKTIVERFEAISNEETLKKYAKYSRIALALERLPHDNYAIGTYLGRDAIERFRLMKEDFYWEETVIMTRKSSVLLPKLNDFIFRIYEAGLVSYWQNEAVMLHMDTYIQNAVQYFITNKERLVVKLKWNHVAGAFNILIFGCVASTIIFIFEVGVYYLKSKNISNHIQVRNVIHLDHNLI